MIDCLENREIGTVQGRSTEESAKGGSRKGKDRKDE
jgi:hypothetical protein